MPDWRQPPDVPYINAVFGFSNPCVVLAKAGIRLAIYSDGKWTEEGVEWFNDIGMPPIKTDWDKVNRTTEKWQKEVDAKWRADGYIRWEHGWKLDR